MGFPGEWSYIRTQVRYCACRLCNQRRDLRERDSEVRRGSRCSTQACLCSSGRFRA